MNITSPRLGLSNTLFFNNIPTAYASRGLYAQDVFEASAPLLAAPRSDKKKSIAEHRFLDLQKDVQDLLNTPETLALDMKHLKYGLRPALFKLEGLYRLYKKRDPLFMDGLTAVKELEDTIGAYDYKNKLLQKAQEVDVDPAAMTQLQQDLTDAQGALENLLASKWLGANGQATIEELNDNIENFKFGKTKDEMKFIRKRIAKAAQKLLEEELDMTDMEGGVHEYRRNLRWFSMYLNSIEGGVYLDETKNPIPELKALLTAPISTVEYAKLNEDNLVKGAVALPKSVYFGIIDDVKNIGDVKDVAETVEGLAYAYVNAGLASDHHDALERVLNVYDLPQDYLQQVAKQVSHIYDNHKSTGLMDAYAKAFKG